MSPIQQKSKIFANNSRAARMRPKRPWPSRNKLAKILVL